MTVGDVYRHIKYKDHKFKILDINGKCELIQATIGANSKVGTISNIRGSIEFYELDPDHHIVTQQDTYDELLSLINKKYGI